MVRALSVELQAHTVHLGGGSGPTPRVESGPLFEVWAPRCLRDARRATIEAELSYHAAILNFLARYDHVTTMA